MDQLDSRTREFILHLPPGHRPAELVTSRQEARPLKQNSHGPGMDIMSAMDLKDLTTQKIQKLVALVADLERGCSGCWP